MYDKFDEKYGPGLAISDYSLGIFYMLAVSSLATYGILLAGFFYLSPSFVQIIDYNPIEFQEKLLISQLEAKHTLFAYKIFILQCIYYLLNARIYSVNSFFRKYVRSTTSRLDSKLIILPRVIGVLNYFFKFPFLSSIIIIYNMAWLSFNVFYLILILFVLCCITSAAAAIIVYFDSIFSSYINKYSNQTSHTSDVKFNIGRSVKFSCFNNSCSRNNKFKRFYSTKTSSSYEYTAEDLLKESTGKNNKELNVEDLKALHSLYIKDLYKDRIAPTVPFDSSLILASCNLSDIKERSELLKE